MNNHSPFDDPDQRAPANTGPSGSTVARDYLAKSLVQTQQRTLRQCSAHIARSHANRQIVYTGITALQLCRLETPQMPALIDHDFHVAYLNRSKRPNRNDTGYLRWTIRSRDSAVPSDGPPTSQSRIMTNVPHAANLQFRWGNSVVTCTHPLTTWALLSPYLSQIDVIVLADAMLRGTSCPIPLTLADITNFLGQTAFPAHAKCTAALPFLATVTDSPMEARTMLALLRDGLPRPVTQWTIFVPALQRTVTVDLAYPDQRVIIEYDGDAHRIDKRQYRRDERKRQALRAMGFMVIVVFADDVLTENGRHSFSRRVADALGIAVIGTPQPEYRALLTDDRLSRQRERQRRYRMRRHARGEPV